MGLKRIISLVIAVVLFIIGTSFLLYVHYIGPVTKESNEKIIEIKPGSSSRDIGNLLYNNKLIKSDKFFLIYLKINEINDMKAGTYKLNSNMNLKKIIKIIQNGDIYQDETIKITFKEGINYREFARVIEKNTNNSYDEVLNILNDKDYLNTLIEDYWFITSDILNGKIYYPLEGYLFPDTYEFKNKNVTVPEIIKKLLDQMDNVLAPYKNKISIDKYSIHELLTLASIAEKEVNNKNENDRKKVVSVFVNRLNKKMSLGSDITARYGIKLDDTRPLTKAEYADKNPYNTRNVNNIGLIPSPICMVSRDSIEASIERLNTNYLYFISNINTGETFFFEKSKDFEAKKTELSKVNGGY